MDCSRKRRKSEGSSEQQRSGGGKTAGTWQGPGKEEAQSSMKWVASLTHGKHDIFLGDDFGAL